MQQPGKASIDRSARIRVAAPGAEAEGGRRQHAAVPSNPLVYSLFPLFPQSAIAYSIRTQSIKGIRATHTSAERPNATLDRRARDIPTPRPRSLISARSPTIALCDGGTEPFGTGRLQRSLQLVEQQRKGQQVVSLQFQDCFARTSLLRTPTAGLPCAK